MLAQLWVIILKTNRQIPGRAVSCFLGMCYLGRIGIYEVGSHVLEQWRFTVTDTIDVGLAGIWRIRVLFYESPTWH